MNLEQYRSLPTAKMSGLKEIEDMSYVFAAICIGDDRDHNRCCELMIKKLSGTEVWDSAEMLSYLYWFYMDKVNAGTGSRAQELAWAVFLKVANERIYDIGGSLENISVKSGSEGHSREENNQRKIE